MTNIHRFERKRDDSTAGSRKPPEEPPNRIREKKKPSRPIKGQRDQSAGRDAGETPRGTTIPPYPKESIDD
jgi:hypothetical protein